MTSKTSTKRPARSARKRSAAIAPSFDKTWETLYADGTHLNRYPISQVVSFIFRHHPRYIPRAKVRILEIGSGAANNMWFAAREGFSVTGIDASKSAVAYARKRFAEDGLSGQLDVGDFTKLPYKDASFDLAINRAAMTQTGLTNGRKAIDELRRTLKRGGLVYSEIYSDRTSSGGRPGPDGVTLDVEGLFSNVGQICFYSQRQVQELFAPGWEILSLQHVDVTIMDRRPYDHLGQWNVVARKL